MLPKLKSLLNDARFSISRPEWWLNARREVQVLHRWISKDSLVFDIGANHGDYVEKYLRLGARVIAVEPQPKCVSDLRQQFGSNRMVTIVDKAVGASVGSAKMRICDADVLSSLSDDWTQSVVASGRFADHQWVNEIDVATTTLEELIKTFGKPKFCKIDVEGFEAQVLAGLSTPITCISCEYTPETFHLLEPGLRHLMEIGKYQWNFIPHYTWQWSMRQFEPLDNASIDKLAKPTGTLKLGGDLWFICSN